MISATQAHKSDNLCYTMSQFSLSFFYFGHTKYLGICEAVRVSSGASSKNREKKEHLEEPSNWDSLCGGFDVTGLQMLLQRMQTLN